MSVESVLELLDLLEDNIENSSNVPFTNKAMIDRDEIFEIITDIRLKLPNEIKQSRWVMEERNKILIEAQREADVMIKDTEGRLNRLVDEHEITKKAHQRAEEILENAKQTAREMRLGAREYADEILASVEKKLKDTVEIVHKDMLNFENDITQTLQVIQSNREEIRGQRK